MLLVLEDNAHLGDQIDENRPESPKSRKQIISLDHCLSRKQRYLSFGRLRLLAYQADNSADKLRNGGNVQILFEIYLAEIAHSVLK